MMHENHDVLSIIKYVKDNIQSDWLLQCHACPDVDTRASCLIVVAYKPTDKILF